MSNLTAGSVGPGAFGEQNLACRLHRPQRDIEGPLHFRHSRALGRLVQTPPALWGGDGAARLLESAPERGGMLLERIEPGTMLASMAELGDDDATRITARLLRQLWRSPEPASGLIALESWCAAYDRNRQTLTAGVPGFPVELFQRADALRAELLSSIDQRV